MDFQQRFKELLEEKDIKYSSVASQTGIPVTTLSNYINRGSAPSITQLSILADFFNCTVDYLIGREDDFGIVNVVSQDAKTTLSPDEEKLLKYYRQLGPFGRETVLAQTKAILEIEEKNVSSLEKNKV